MPHRVAIIPGDGIGRDVVAEVVPILTALGGLELEQLPWSADYYLQTGVTIPAGGYATLQSFDAIFVGALGDPRVPDNRHARDILLGTRFELDLFVNYRPVRLLDDRLCPLKNRGRRDVNGCHRHRCWNQRRCGNDSRDIRDIPYRGGPLAIRERSVHLAL